MHTHHRTTPVSAFRRAFTLVEMVAVMVILALLAAMAVPRYAQAINNQRVEAAKRRVTVDLLMAQRRAKTRGEKQTVVFDTATLSYRIPGVTHLDHPSEEYEVRLGREPYAAKAMAVELDGDTEIVFNPYGIPDSGGTVKMTIGNRIIVLTVDADTGEVTDS